MPEKYYGVKAGYRPGVYKTWEECKKQVHGFSGASFKSFPTRREAELFSGLFEEEKTGSPEMDSGQAEKDGMKTELAEMKNGQAGMETQLPEMENRQAEMKSGQAEKDGMKTEPAEMKNELPEMEHEQAAMKFELPEMENRQTGMETQLPEMGNRQAEMKSGQAEKDGMKTEPAEMKNELPEMENRQTGMKPELPGMENGQTGTKTQLPEMENRQTGIKPQRMEDGDGETIPIRTLSDGEAVAYVDGSYDHSVRAFAYGVVLFHEGREEHLSGKSADPDLAEMRNVAGEIRAAEVAMQYCLDHNIKSIHIYHDYEGIAKWCTGEWKANKAGTKAYRAFYQRIQSDLQVYFVKVKGHSGDRYNDVADQLAKGALGIGAKGRKDPQKRKMKIKK